MPTPQLSSNNLLVVDEFSADRLDYANLMVALSSTDAQALSVRFKCPVVVTTSPTELSTFRPGSSVRAIIYALPKGLESDWYSALQESLRAIVGLVRAVKALEPATSARERTWAEYLQDLPTHERVDGHVIDLASPAP